jgi:curved DNA-binding protein CbpA
VRNHYETLGLPFGASAEEIRKRYRELVRRYHPDVNPSPDAKERFLRIQEAYQVLSDPERRRHYDALLRLRMQEQGRAGFSASQTARPASASPPPSRSASQTALDEARRAILQAEQAFLQGRLRDALHWARPGN